MANEPLALAIEPEMPSEDDYRAFCAALSETARGRAFLAEYARRQRAADTGMLLGALERLEGLVRSQAPTRSDDGVRQELLELLDGIRDMQAEIDAGGLTMQVAKLASLIDVVQQRLEAIVTIARPEGALATDETATPKLPPVATHDTAPPADENFEQSEVAFAQIIPDESADAAHAPALLIDEPAVEMAGESAAQAAPSEQAESPTPTFAAAPDHAIAPPAKSAAMPEVSWFDGAQQGRAALAVASAQAPARSPSPTLAIAAVIEAATMAASTAEPEAPAFTVFKAGTIPPPTPFAGEDFSRPQRAADTAPPADPLAPITSLSDDERLALFT